MFKRFSIGFLLFVQLCSLTPHVYAQDATINLQNIPDIQLQPNETDVGAALSPMKIGQKAPFTGVLLSPRAVAIMIAQIHAIEEQIAIEVTRAKAETQAEGDFRVSEATTQFTADITILNAQLEARDQELIILNEVIRQHEKSRPNVMLWTGLGAAVGFVIGAGITVLTVYAINQASN